MSVGAAVTTADAPRRPAEVLRSRTGPPTERRPRDVLFRVYLAALFGPVVYFGASDVAAAVAALLGAPFPLTAPTARTDVATVLAGAAAAAVALVVHTGVWRGPLLLDRADLRWLLASPMPRRTLLGPRLRRAALRHAATGAAAGAVAGSLAATALGGAVFGATVTGAVGGGSLTLLGLAGSWWPVVRPDRAARTLRVATVCAGAAVALAVVALVVPAVSPLLSWTGPWGWVAIATAAAADGEPAPAIALLGLAAATAAAATRGILVTAGRGHPEGLARTTGAAAGTAAAAYMLDLAAVAEVRREALDALRPNPRLRLPAPRRPAFAVAWRDATALARAPGRSLAAVAGVAAAALIAAVGLTATLGAAPTGDGATAVRGPSLLALGILVAQVAAGLLVAPLRSALSRPFGHLFLPWGHLRLVRRHLAVPTVALVVSGALAAGLAAAAVGAPGLPAAVGAALVAPVLVLDAALRTLRPPRAPHEVAESVLANEYGAFALALRSWPRLLVPVGITLAATVLLRAAVSPAAAGALGSGAAAVAAAAMWWRIGHRAAPWGG